jgi:hypothetical protein
LTCTHGPSHKRSYASRGFLNLELGKKNQESGIKIRQWAIGVVMIFTDVMVKGYRK